MEHMEEIADNIKDYLKEHGFPPSGRQIADELKLDYDKAVKPVIDKLVEDGKITIDNTKEKIIDLLDD